MVVAMYEKTARVTGSMLLFAWLMGGCGGADPPGSAMDTGVVEDRGPIVEDRGPVDTGVPEDREAPVDAGPVDTGVPADEGMSNVDVIDAGQPEDAIDAGLDTGLDVPADDGRSDVPDVPDVPVTNDVPPIDAGGLVLRSGGFSTLGPRAWVAGMTRIYDDGFEYTGGRQCSGMVCLTGGFLR